MKKFISCMILMFGLFLFSPSNYQTKAANSQNQKAFVIDQQNKAPAVLAQEEGGVDPAESAIKESVPEPAEGGNFFLDNWGALLMGLLGFFDLVARLTPTEKDNSIVNFLMTLFNAIIPNFKKGGGNFQFVSK